jgi:hypothetical protein
MKCSWNTCQAEAVGAIALNVPAMNIPIPEHDPIRLILGLELCGWHQHEIKSEDVLSDQIRYIIVTAAQGRAPVDFDRAFMTPVSFESQEWKALKLGPSRGPE